MISIGQWMQSLKRKHVRLQREQLADIQLDALFYVRQCAESLRPKYRHDYTRVADDTITEVIKLIRAKEEEVRLDAGMQRESKPRLKDLNEIAPRSVPSELVDVIRLTRKALDAWEMCAAENQAMVRLRDQVKLLDAVLKASEAPLDLLRAVEISLKEGK